LPEEQSRMLVLLATASERCVRYPVRGRIQLVVAELLILLLDGESLRMSACLILEALGNGLLDLFVLESDVRTGRMEAPCTERSLLLGQTQKVVRKRIHGISTVSSRIAGAMSLVTARHGASALLPSLDHTSPAARCAIRGKNSRGTSSTIARTLPHVCLMLLYARPSAIKRGEGLPCAAIFPARLISRLSK